MPELRRPEHREPVAQVIDRYRDMLVLVRVVGHRVDPDRPLGARGGRCLALASETSGIFLEIES